MTNFAKYKEELFEILVDCIGVDKNTGKPYECNGEWDCSDCLFDGCDGFCHPHIKEWLDAEYIPPKDHIEIATLISFLRMEPNQMKQVKSIKIVDGMPVINGDEI